jgi:dTDP-4-amino-4,6-dideoxy-D-galactose acyltransferase
MIEKLEWDSDFFGYPVGMLKAPEIGRLDMRQFRREARNYRLIYVFLDHPARRKPRNFKLVDRKIVLQRTTAAMPDGPHSGGIIRFRGRANRSLIRLALESGKYSRFRTDPQFRNGEFERLFTRWIKNSVNGVSAKAVFVCRVGKRTAGFVTLTADRGSAAIGLIAVDETDRGKGIGTALIRRAVAEAFNLGYGAISVATQMTNDPAVRLYRKNGFKTEAITAIYHYWVEP